MKPFLILQLRPIDLASNNEFAAFLHYGELLEQQTHRIRMDKEGIPRLNLSDYSGVIIGGGPSNVSDDEQEKHEYQKRFEADLFRLLDEVFKRDVPVLGNCYGIGAISKFMGTEVSKKRYSEGIGAVEIELNEDGKKDPLLQGLPSKFLAYVGHKEACQALPHGATLLAGSKTCPIQMIRVKENIYATQFHTELDAEGIELRINVYKNHGYFSPEDADLIVENSKKYRVHIPGRILRNFIRLYAKEY
jgi:GMP synthase (glutamine-hydrolysing)